MNRRNKAKKIFEARLKRANAKLAPAKNKPKYICKADRAKLAAQAEADAAKDSEV